MITRLVSSEETRFGELIIVMKRGNQAKEYILSNGYLDELYNRLMDYYCDQLGWSQNKLDQYLDDEENEEREIDDYVGMIVDLFDDQDNWNDL